MQSSEQTAFAPLHSTHQSEDTHVKQQIQSSKSENSRHEKHDESVYPPHRIKKTPCRVCSALHATWCPYQPSKVSGWSTIPAVRKLRKRALLPEFSETTSNRIASTAPPKPVRIRKPKPSSLSQDLTGAMSTSLTCLPRTWPPRSAATDAPKATPHRQSSHASDSHAAFPRTAYHGRGSYAFPTPDFRYRGREPHQPPSHALTRARLNAVAIGKRACHFFCIHD